MQDNQMQNEAATIAEQPNEARLALEELTQVAHDTEQLLTADATGLSAAPTTEISIPTPVTDDEVDMLRARASRQRASGRKTLAQRHDGIASLIVDVTINERVVASTFERFYPIIERGIYVIARRGDLFLGEASARTVIETTIKKIEALEATITTDLAGVKLQLDLHSGRDEFVQPNYTAPSAKHQVQVRHPLANRVLKLFVKQDEVIGGLQVLNWNEESDAGTIEDQEYRFKRDTRDLAMHILRTLRGMRSRVSRPPKKAESAEAVAEAA
ncbi:hypothetical protein [Noviherbaspirillum malthae]|uniref:hypothetical protein n=1 Tax=Noviherbaspirillum malthae TaxID=1260987 RepID=UPI00188EF21A|nr:hypothetical protein [Noviherbaspirillum malthae]